MSQKGPERPARSPQQVTQSKASGMTTHWKEPLRLTACVWVVVAGVILGRGKGVKVAKIATSCVIPPAV
jgi:hypothetical protein